MYGYALWLTLATLVAVQCELDATPSQFIPNNNVNYGPNPDQSFTTEDRPTLYTPYGFYGPPVNHPMDSYSYGTIGDQQQMKVKKDINGANAGGSLVLDGIR